MKEPCSAWTYCGHTRAEKLRTGEVCWACQPVSEAIQGPSLPMAYITLYTCHCGCVACHGLVRFSWQIKLGSYLVTWWKGWFFSPKHNLSNLWAVSLNIRIFFILWYRLLHLICIYSGWISTDLFYIYLYTFFGKSVYYMCNFFYHSLFLCLGQTRLFQFNMDHIVSTVQIAPK